MPSDPRKRRGVDVANAFKAPATLPGAGIAEGGGPQIRLVQSLHDGTDPREIRRAQLIVGQQDHFPCRFPQTNSGCASPYHCRGSHHPGAADVRVRDLLNLQFDVMPVEKTTGYTRKSCRVRFRQCDV